MPKKHQRMLQEQSIPKAVAMASSRQLPLRRDVEEQEQHGDEEGRGVTHLLAVALREVDDEAAHRRQRHERARAGVPQVGVDRRRLPLPCKRTHADAGVSDTTRHEKKKRRRLSELGHKKRELPPAGDKRMPQKRSKVAKEVPSHAAAPVESGAGAATGAGATPELAGDCFMVGHAGASLVAHEHGAGARGAALRCAASLPARQRAPPAGRVVVLGGNNLLPLGVVAPDAALARRAAWRRLPDNASSSSSSRRPRGVPERERGEVLSCWLVGALPRELKRNAPCFSLFPRLLARLKREKEDRERQQEEHHSLQLSAQPSQAQILFRYKNFFRF